MDFIFWIGIFIISLAVLIKAADYFTESSERIGLALRISPFIIGVTIVSVGTSLPELATGIVGALGGHAEIAVANAFGSNIANILLIVGFCGIIAGTLAVKRDLIDLDLPLLMLATAIALIIVWDGTVNFREGIIAILAYFVYSFYTFSSRSDGIDEKEKEQLQDIKKEIVPITREDRFNLLTLIRSGTKKVGGDKTREIGVDILIIGASAIAIYFSAEWTVRSMEQVALFFGIPASIVAMTGIAIGTSLPELIISVDAVRKGKYEIALGNVFGSNIFNLLMVIGIPAIFIGNLTVDHTTLTIGSAFLVGTTLLYVFSGISRKIHRWEGSMYLLIYVLFIAKLFGLF